MLSVRTWLPCDEIHIDQFPLPSRNVDLLSHTSWFPIFYLDLLAIGALTHKICYIPLHDIPLVHYSQITVHLSGTFMNRISGVMIFFKNIPYQLTHIRNRQSTLVAKYTNSPWEKTTTLWLWTAPLSSGKIGLMSCLSLTSSTKENGSPF